jgi:anti-sigma regulatory factor (Ser/Thr protein kinase)
MDRIGGSSSVFRLDEPEDAGSLRRAVRQLALELHAADNAGSRAELAATELATNAITHAPRSGYALLQPTNDGSGLEILAVDRGQGIADVTAALGGPSPAEIERAVAEGGGRLRGLGCGLASVQRLASEFDIYSVRDQGTAVLARFFFGPRPPPAIFRGGGVSLPLVDGDENGDGWAFRRQGSQCWAFLVDGLGHGKGAAEAAQAALGSLRPEVYDIEECLHGAHLAMRATRGGSASVFRIDGAENRAWFGGIGNVEGRVHTASGSVGLAPRNGTLGMNLQLPAVRTQEVKWEPGATLMLHSDGIRSRFERDAYRGLLEHDPALIAAVVHRDLSRGRDDATVLVVHDTRRADA